MLLNVVKLESKAALLARNPASCPAILLLEFAAAFPCLAREFIWIALVAIGITKNYSRIARLTSS